MRAVADGRSPILLTERRDHLELLASRLRGFTRHLIVLHGGLSPKTRRGALAQLAAIPDTEERCVVAIGRYLGEGFDDARLDALFLTLPIAWKGTLVQYAGRLHRRNPGKTEIRIYDYVDTRVPLLARMADKRLRATGPSGGTHSGLSEACEREGRNILEYLRFMTYRADLERRRGSRRRSVQAR